MDHHGNSVNAGGLGHAEKILEARFDPRRLSGLVMNGDLAAGGQAKALGRGLGQTGRPKRGQEVGGSEIGEARAAAA